MIMNLCVPLFACLEADRIFSAGVAAGCGVLGAQETPLGVDAIVIC